MDDITPIMLDSNELKNPPIVEEDSSPELVAALARIKEEAEAIAAEKAAIEATNYKVEDHQPVSIILTAEQVTGFRNELKRIGEPHADLNEVIEYMKSLITDWITYT